MSYRTWIACCDVVTLPVQALAKRLLGGSGVITSLAVHPGGDHVLVGSEDKRLAWCVHCLCDSVLKGGDSKGGGA
jgi:hypothetical protein